MTVPAFDQRRSAAIRSRLSQVVETPSRRPRLWQGLMAFVIAGALTGGAVSATALAVTNSARPTLDAVGGQTVDGVDGIPAPEGTSPGTPVISLVGSIVSQTVDGDAEIPLVVPAGATHVRVAMTCLTPGLTYWGTDPGGNNPSSECTSADLPDDSRTSYSFAVDSGTSLYISAEAGVMSIVSYQFTTEIPTAWGVNDNGETFGVPKEGAGEPDLLLVTGTDTQGKPVDGYARQEDLNGVAPGAGGVVEIPVYESDGLTQIGIFAIGGGSTP